MNGWEYMHDVLAEIEFREYTQQECEDAYNRLPDHIKMIAANWGMADTVFRDQAYVWLRENK